ncbi:MAG: serine/threonine-protein phosphatase, partial [Proteobacteria bacterium]|nr:serine/threonine-protein phosphatase [Pseudomonadota bacterium]
DILVQQVVARLRELGAIGKGLAGHVRIGNAGHLPPLLGTGGDWRLLDPAPSSLLGIWEQGEFAETEVQLSVGQTLVFYSDGVTEAHATKQGEHFGDLRLRQCLLGSDGSAREAVERVVAAVSQHAAGDQPFDDITVLALRYRGLPPAAAPN